MNARHDQIPAVVMEELRELRKRVERLEGSGPRRRRRVPWNKGMNKPVCSDGVVLALKEFVSGREVMLTGARGLYESRDNLPAPLRALGRERLRTLAKQNLQWQPGCPLR